MGRGSHTGRAVLPKDARQSRPVIPRTSSHLAASPNVPSMRMSRVALAIVAIILVIAFASMAFIPLSTNDLGPHPQPMSKYESAITEIARREQADARVAASSGRSILLTHGRRTPITVVLLHGFTNSPLQFDSLGRILYSEGDNVYIPRLPHHADKAGSAALSLIKATELRAAADSAVDVADGLGDTVVVVGLSLGGTMASWIAQYRGDVRRVVIVAPVMALARIPSALAKPLVNLAVRMPNVIRSETRTAGEPDREPGWSTHSVGQILRLGLAVQRASVDTTAAIREINILLNGHDHTISPRPVLEVARRWGAHGATVHAYELSTSLGLPHDVIDPRQPVRRLDVVYPAIAALVRGNRPAGGDVQDAARSVADRGRRSSH